MRKRRLSTRALAILVAAGVLAYAAAGYLALVKGKRAESARLEAQIAQVEQELAERRRLLATKPGEVEPIAVADIFRLTKAMPSTPDMPGILLELSRIAAETGIEFESIAPQASVDKTGYQQVPINLVFSGNFYELADFLFRLRTLVGVHGGALEATGRLFSVESINFAEGRSGFPQIEATLTADAYVYGTGAPATTGTPQTPPATGATTTSSSGESGQPNPDEPPAAPEAAAQGGAS